MDPASIFQTVGCAVEIASTTYKIISAGNDIYKQGRKNLPLNESRERATKDLSALNVDFIERYAKVPEDKLSDEERRRLEMCKACNSIAEELIQALAKLEVHGEEKSKRKSLGVALKSVWNESDIEEKKQRLEEYRSQLMAGYVMSILRSTEKQAAASEKHQRGLEDVSKVLKSLEDSSISRHDNSIAQNELLLDTVNQIRARLEETTLKPPTPDMFSKRRLSTQSSTSFDGYTLVDNESIVPRARTIHEIVAEGDREALYDKLDEDAMEVRTKDDAGRTPLHIAVISSNERIVQDLLSKGARVDALDRTFSTPLHYAAKQGLVRTVRKLVTAGANIDLENRDDFSAWSLAVEFPEIQWILRNGASLEARNSNRETALVHFTRERDIGVVRSLLDQGADVGSHGEGGQTALIEAAWQDNFEIVELLLDHNNRADINDTNHRGDTPLGCHCQLDGEPDIRIFKKLLAAKPDITMRNDCNFNAAFEAAAHGHPEQLETLIDMGAELDMCEVGGYNPLTWAARQGHASTIRILLEKQKYEADTPDEKGHTQTALMGACIHGHIEAVRVLLQYGADVNIIGVKLGLTSLHHAVIHKHSGIVRELLKVEGIDVNAPSKAQWRPLCEAAQRHHYQITNFLLEAGANPNVKDDAQRTPLMKAAQVNSVKVVNLLLDHGARVDTVDKDGHTALMNCARDNKLNTARVLLERGASVRGTSREKAYTPLCLASMMGHLDMVKLLLEHGASAATDANIDLWTPLHEAAHYGHFEIAHVLLDHGADTLVKNTARKPPLAMALEREHIKLVKLMCKYIED